MATFREQLSEKIKLLLDKIGPRFVPASGHTTLQTLKEEEDGDDEKAITKLDRMTSSPLPLHQFKSNIFRGARRRRRRRRRPEKGTHMVDIIFAAPDSSYGLGS